MMVVQDFIPEFHYEKLASWWNGHNWPAVPLRYLPSQGFIVEDLAAGFLYATDSQAAIMDWIVGNPKASSREVYRAIRAVVNHCVKVASADGYEVIFTALNKKGLIKAYEKEGFKVSDMSMTHMIWRRI